MYNEKLEKAVKKYEDKEKWKTLKDGEKDVLNFYYKSRGEDNLAKKIIVDDIVWDYDYEDFIKALNKYDVKELIFSSTWSNAINLLMVLMENGFTPAGTEVYNKTEIWYNGNVVIKKGIILIKK